MSCNETLFEPWREHSCRPGRLGADEREGRHRGPRQPRGGRLRAPRTRDRGHRGARLRWSTWTRCGRTPTTCCGGPPASRSGSPPSRSAPGRCWSASSRATRGTAVCSTYTLPETLWLAREGFEDLVVGYPTVDRTAIGELARLTDAQPGSAPVLMVDSTEHLDLIEAAAGGGDAPIRVALELDVGYWPLGGRLKIGPKRSPIRTPRQAAELAREIGSTAAAAAGRADGLRGPHRRARRPPAGQAPPGRGRSSGSSPARRARSATGAPRSSQPCRSWPSSSS